MTDRVVLETIRTDDFIEYFLFPGQKQDESASEEDNNQLDVLLKQIEAITDQFCSGYIWHKDDFRLSAVYGNPQTSSNNDDLPPHLHGITSFGDNIEDEWFIVSILFELSRKVPGLIVRIIDSDGEFLLIEAAEYLPEWCDPRTCEQRVYIFNGTVHIIDNSIKSHPTNSLLPVRLAIDALLNNPTAFKVSQAIHDCLQKRIDVYPERISDTYHHATVYLPSTAAVLLHDDPQLISAVCRSFCQRDSIDMKSLRAMKYFPPEDRVNVRVKFSKCLYAMMKSNKFTPDSRIGWKLPAINAKQYNAHVLGVKLACGFEILASQACPQEDFEQNREWLTYIERLKKTGYFSDYLEHSKDWKRLWETAKQYFTENFRMDNESSRIGQQIIDRIQKIDYNMVDTLRNGESSLPPDDDESWLNISPEQLDNLLHTRYGIKKIINSNGNVDPIEFTEDVNQFLEQKSDYDGVTVPPPVRPNRKEKPKENIVENMNESHSSTIDFNPDAYINHIKGMLDIFIPEDKWDSNSDMSDFSEDNDLQRNIDELGDGATVDMNAYMERMDRELARTTIGKSFEKKSDDFDDIEDFKPVDIDVNALKNLMGSYQAQYGGPGPTSNLLGSMGIGMSSVVPKDDDESKELNTQV